MVFLRLGSERALNAPSSSTVNLRLSRFEEAPAASGGASVSWKLRPILDAIGASVGGGIPGQLLIYKVFLQLPPDLLQAAGLQSLSAVDEHFTVTHPALRNALVEAARRHASIDVASLVAA